MYESRVIEAMKRFFEVNAFMDRNEFYILTGIRIEENKIKEEVSQPCASTAEE